MIRLFKDERWHSFKCRLKDLTFWLGWATIALIAMMKIQGWPVSGVYHWMLNKPTVFFLNYSIILGIFCFFYALVYDRLMAVLFSMYSILLFGYGQRLKRLYLDDNLLPSDFLMLKEVATLLPTLETKFILVGLMLCLFAPILIYICYRIWSLKHRGFMQRAGLIVLPLSFFAALTSVIKVPVLDDYLSRLPDQNNLHVGYHENGLMLSFALILGQMLEQEVLDDYSADSLYRILSHPVPLKSGSSPAIRPNVIILMSESLFDPTSLPLTYSKDPLQHFHALQKQHGRSSLISPSYGGDTCNTEFEVMTGLSMNFFQRGDYPYMSYIRQPLPALPRIFKENGYHTLAIHPYHRAFFNREKIYKFLGFDDYYSIEDWENPVKAGEYVSDKDLVQKIINKSETSPEPYFIYAISMQNHITFSTPQDPQLKILSESLSEESHRTLGHYLAGVQDADDALQSLVEYLEQSSRPTMLVFFGDHLPSLPAVYGDTDFFATSGNPLAKYTVPALIWSNYKAIPPLDSASTFYLGRYVLEQAGITPPLHFQFLGQLFENYPVLSYDHGVNNQLIEDYRLLQYDLISGEQYLWKFTEEQQNYSM